jgi:thioredoxin 1
MKSSFFFSLLIPVLIPFITTDHNKSSNKSAGHSIAIRNDHTRDGAIEFTDANFQSKVLSNDKLTIVDFWASWCGPCRRMGPIIEDLATAYNGKVNIGKLDVDKNPKTCAKYSITSIPTILFVKNGEVVDKLTGVFPKDKMVKIIEQHLKAR